MIEQDTIRLLRECDAGIKMGVGSIDEVLGQVRGGELRQCLIKCRNEHEKLAGEIQTLLAKYHDKGKEPSPVAKGMSWIKTNAKMGMDDSDQTVANLMTDGLQYGCQVPEYVSEPVQGRGRGLKGHHKTAHQPRTKAHRRYTEVSVNAQTPCWDQAGCLCVLQLISGFVVCVHPLVILHVFTGDDLIHPLSVVQVPLDSAGHAGLESVLRVQPSSVVILWLSIA